MPIANTRTDIALNQHRRGFWLRTLHQWHWISSALATLGMLLFSITGITLNHASQIKATPRIVQLTAILPEALLAQLSAPTEGLAPLPQPIATWVNAEFDLAPRGREAEWSDDELYLALPSPGADAWISIDRLSGAVEFESTDRGWVAYFNDLHKGRNSGIGWAWFIDAFAVICIVFCLSGLFLLHMHARQRRMTWPYVGLGALVPALIALLLIH